MNYKFGSKIFVEKPEYYHIIQVLEVMFCLVNYMLHLPVNVEIVIFAARCGCLQFF